MKRQRNTLVSRSRGRTLPPSTLQPSSSRTPLSTPYDTRRSKSPSHQRYHSTSSQSDQVTPTSNQRFHLVLSHPSHLPLRHSPFTFSDADFTRLSPGCQSRRGFHDAHDSDYDTSTDSDSDSESDFEMHDPDCPRTCTHTSSNNRPRTPTPEIRVVSPDPNEYVYCQASPGYTLTPRSDFRVSGGHPLFSQLKFHAIPDQICTGGKPIDFGTPIIHNDGGENIIMRVDGVQYSPAAPASPPKTRPKYLDGVDRAMTSEVSDGPFRIVRVKTAAEIQFHKERRGRSSKHKKSPSANSLKLSEEMQTGAQ